MDATAVAYFRTETTRVGHFERQREVIETVMLTIKWHVMFLLKLSAIRKINGILVAPRESVVKKRVVEY